MLDWLDEVELDRVGCFEYEPVEGARAEALDLPQVPPEVKKDRWNRFMAHQQKISARRMAAKIGTQIIVMVDEVTEEGVIARSTADAPEIDGVVYVATDMDDIEQGDFIAVEVVDADEYDLYAEHLPEM